MSDTGNILIDAFNLPPKEASDRFSKKDNRHSWYYAEVWEEAHARSFTVAKAMTADILQDIRDALQKGIDSGESYGAWKARIEPVLRAKGWWGLVPANMVPGAPPNAGSEPVMLGSPHRLENIFRTNIQSAYQAGRFHQALAVVDTRPYWQYVAVMDGRTRPSHAAMNGRVFKWNDPVWNFAHPVNGYKCRCTVRTLSKSELDRDGLSSDSSDGKVTTKTVFVNKSKGIKTEVSVLDLGNGKTFSPDPGFNSNNAKVAWEPDPSKYSPAIRQQLAKASGAPAAPPAAQQKPAQRKRPEIAPGIIPDKFDTMPEKKARKVVKEAVASSAFDDFHAGKGGDLFPVAILTANILSALGSRQRSLLLSKDTIKSHGHHAEIGVDEYRKIQEIVDKGEVLVEKEGRVIVLSDHPSGYKYRLSIKATKDKAETFVNSLFITRYGKKVRNKHKKWAGTR